MINIRLNDLQLVLLSTAAQRADSNLLPLPDSIRDQTPRATKAIEWLINKGLAEEQAGVAKAITWREDGDIRIGVVITDAGRVAINAADESADHGTQVPAVSPPPAPAEPRITKRAQLIEMLKREGGASIAEIVEAMDWLPHTSHAALTGLRKSGLTLTSEKADDVRRYRIIEAG